MSLFLSSVVFVLFVTTFLYKETEAYTIQHFSISSFDVSVEVDFDSACDTSSDITQVVTVPRGSSVLNVLENANQLFPTFNGFKVLYLANSSYHLIGLNGVEDNPTTNCSWIFSTDPPTTSSASHVGYRGILSDPLNEVFVSNIGMTITFQYTTGSSILSLISKSDFKKQAVKNTIPAFRIGPPLSVDYSLTYPEPTHCPSPPTLSSSPPLSTVSLSLVLGDSALNVMEAAANAQPSYHFVVSNIFGKFYVIDSAGGAAVSQSCIWCAYFTPQGGSAYLLTADTNNFIVPITGGDLTLKYQQTCSVAMDDFNRGKLDYNIPIPPHYNPFANWKRPSAGGGCTDHCHAN